MRRRKVPLLKAGTSPIPLFVLGLIAVAPIAWGEVDVGGSSEVPILSGPAEVKTSRKTPVAERKTEAQSCPKKPVFTVAKVTGYRSGEEKAFFFRSIFAIDVAGAPKAFHPQQKKGLCDLKMTGRPGRWVGLVTDNGTPGGKPLIQGPKDPAPGFYISMTTLFDPKRSRRDPRRYVNSEEIPYFVLNEPVMKKTRARPGDFGVMLNPRNGKYEFAIFADKGLGYRLGEGSIFLAKALGLPAATRTGGTQRREIVYLVFPESGNRRPRTLAEIRTEGKKLFDQWGGMERLRACVDEKK